MPSRVIPELRGSGERFITDDGPPHSGHPRVMNAAGSDGFTLSFDVFDASEEPLREALTSTGNGYFCTRGAAEWEDASDVHYAGTYAHGIYNRETTILGGRPVANEDLVTMPNWLVLQFRIEGDEPLRLETVELVSYRHTIDPRHA